MKRRSSGTSARQKRRKRPQSSLPLCEFTTLERVLATTQGAGTLLSDSQPPEPHSYCGSPPVYSVTAAGAKRDNSPHPCRSSSRVYMCVCVWVCELSFSLRFICWPLEGKRHCVRITAISPAPSSGACHLSGTRSPSVVLGEVTTNWFSHSMTVTWDRVMVGTVPMGWVVGRGL